MALVFTSISGGAEPDCRAVARSRDFLRSAMDSVTCNGVALLLVAIIFRSRESMYVCFVGV